MGKTREIRERPRQPSGAKLRRPAHPGAAKATAGRIDPKYGPLLVSAIMAVAMSLTMSLFQTVIRVGFTPRLVPDWLTSAALGLVVALPTALLISPHVQRLVSRLTGSPREPAQDSAHAPIIASGNEPR